MGQSIEDIRKMIAIGQEQDKRNELICQKMGHDEEPVLGSTHSIIRCKRCRQYITKFPKCSDDRDVRFGLRWDAKSERMITQLNR